MSPLRRILAAAAAAALPVAGAVAAVPAHAAITPYVSEIHYDNEGPDTGEAIEIAADPGADLSGYSVVLYNGSNGASYGTRALGTANAEGFAVLTYATDGIQNGAPDGIALVDGSGAVLRFLSYEGVMTAVGGPADGMTSTDIGVAEVSSTPIGTSLQLVDGEWAGPIPSTFGAANTGSAPDPDDPGGDPGAPSDLTCATALTHTIGAVQGSGPATPVPAGQQVVVRGVVTSDLQEGGVNGYFLQNTAAFDDDDPATSDGVFVYTPGAARTDVSVGDDVTVRATVTEYNGLTQLTDVTALVCASGVPAPAPAALTLPATDAERERLEGMAVSVGQELTVSEVYDLNRYGQVVLSSGGALINPTEVAEPGDPARAVAAQNAARRILLDDGRTTNLASAGLAPPYLAIDDPVRVGDTVAVGALTSLVLYFNSSYGGWLLEPPSPGPYGDASLFDPANPRPAAPQPVGGDVTVAAFNVLNYFTTLVEDDPSARGAQNAAEFAQQKAKIVSALAALDADVVALMEIENSAQFTPGSPYAAVADLAAAVSAATGQPWAYVEAHEASDVITNAIIYRTDRVAPVGEPAAPAEGDVWGSAREPIAQVFDYQGEQFLVVANHLKSKGSGSGPNADQGDGQGASNPDRIAQAQSLVDFVEVLTAGAGVADVVLLGDFNAYSKEDPIDVLVDAGYTDLAPEFAPGDRSYVFSGESGSLDHAFGSPSLTAKVTGVDIWNINSVEPYAYQYDGFEGLFAPDPYRASDHDPLVIGLDLAPDAPAPAPAVALSTAEARVGDTVTVTATGFVPGSTLSGTLFSDPFPFGSAVADGNGAATLSFVVPAATDPGAHTVTVASSDGLSASAGLTIVAAPAAGPRPAGGAGDLASTGADTHRPLGWAAALVAVGALLVVAGARRSRA